MRTLSLVKAGIASTVQDSGRAGHLQLGIPPSGAMDGAALRYGQYRLHHRADEAAIEMAYADAALIATQDIRVCVTGAPVVLRVDDQTVDALAIQHVKAGQLLSVKAQTTGIYSYLHVGGGVDTARVFNSRSTSPREGIGGLHGRYLRDGDEIPLGDDAGLCGYSAPKLSTVVERDTLTLRYIPCFQHGQMPDVLHQSLRSETFRVTTQANRMGVTLDGPRLETGIEALLSEATCYGAIQIPPDGRPIALLNDRQTVGGYPKAGAIIASDCQRLAQSRPGQAVKFQPCTLAEADRIAWLEQHYHEAQLA